MSENPNQNSLIDVSIPASVDKAIENITSPISKGIGNTLGDLWYLVFGGLSHKADKRRMKYAVDLENYQNELSESIRQIPKEKQTEPSIQITAQALENSKYCISSEVLRKMFVNLISGTMHSEREPLVHPSFPEMIKQMSEDDAKILSILKNQESSTTKIAEISETVASEMDPFRCRRSLTLLEKFGLITIVYTPALADSLFSVRSSKFLSELVESTKESSVDPLYDTLATMTEARRQAPHIPKHYFRSISNDNENDFDNDEWFAGQGFCTVTVMGSNFLEVCVP